MISERALDALKMIDFGKPEVKEILNESYSQEVDFIREVIRAFRKKDLSDEAQLEDFRKEVQKAFDAYMALRPMERKHYIL